MKPHPKISLDCLEASRLYFTNGAIYDSRGYEFARYPETGTYKDKERVDCNVFFGAYDDGDGNFFSFCDADCFDPPQYLIRAADWETAYDIYLNEFGTDYVFETSGPKEQENEANQATENGVATYTDGGRFVCSDTVNGSQLILLRIEGVTQR